jgi:hypothetical protein
LLSINDIFFRNEWQNRITTIENCLAVFEKTAYTLDWSNGENGLINGSEKTQSLDFYLERGRDVVFNIKLFYFGVRRYYTIIDIENSESILNYKKALHLSPALFDHFCEFVSFSKFVIK